MQLVSTMADRSSRSCGCSDSHGPGLRGRGNSPQGHREANHGGHFCSRGDHCDVDRDREFWVDRGDGGDHGFFQGGSSRRSEGRHRPVEEPRVFSYTGQGPVLLNQEITQLEDKIQARQPLIQPEQQVINRLAIT
jgi:hypothetical protein